MSDRELRSLGRVGVGGDLSAQTRELAGRVRRGSELTLMCVTCEGSGDWSRPQFTGRKSTVGEDVIFVAPPGELAAIRELGHKATAIGWPTFLARVGTIEDGALVRIADCRVCKGKGDLVWSWQWKDGRLALAAYLGYQPARTLVSTRKTTEGGWLINTIQRCAHDPATGTEAKAYPCFNDECFPRWISGLARWSLEVIARAGVAAVRAAQLAECYEGDPECTRTKCTPILGYVKKAEAWIDCPCKTHRELCGTYPGSVELGASVCWMIFGSAAVDNVFLDIEESAAIAGHQEVLAAIQAGVLGWVLGD